LLEHVLQQLLHVVHLVRVKLRNVRIVSELWLQQRLQLRMQQLRGRHDDGPGPTDNGSGASCACDGASGEIAIASAEQEAANKTSAQPGGAGAVVRGRGFRREQP
jgi:hypothetical protein